MKSYAGTLVVVRMAEVVGRLLFKPDALKWDYEAKSKQSVKADDLSPVKPTQTTL